MLMLIDMDKYETSRKPSLIVIKSNCQCVQILNNKSKGLSGGIAFYITLFTVKVFFS